MLTKPILINFATKSHARMCASYFIVNIARESLILTSWKYLSSIILMQVWVTKLTLLLKHRAMKIFTEVYKLMYSLSLHLPVWYAELLE